MSSNIFRPNTNIYKSHWFVLQEEDKCVIDSNSRIARRMEELEAELRRNGGEAEDDGDGFRSGLGGERIDAADYEGDTESGNVIKPQEEPEPEGPSLEEIQAQIDAEKEAARAEIEQYKQSARAEIEAERQEVLEEGRNAGYEEGLRRAQAEAAQMREELNRERARMQEEYNQLIDELEPQFIDTITAVYQHIFQTDLENERDILVHLVDSTLRKIESSRTFIVHVSKEDYPYVNMQKKALTEGAVSGRGVVEVVEDITLRKNECMIETDGGIFDCGVGTQLEELTKKLRLLSFEKTVD
ncbi:MAG: FliH/SctL family protein [Blautia sp.]|nr:FliH/SctL family protein [Lachnoclostridium sp.]MCM1210386.1 FliH/SctL family protein [Blautia sp.]